MSENKSELKTVEKNFSYFQFGDNGQFELSIANDRQSREQAYRLLYRSYLDKGFADEYGSKMWCSPYDAHPDTVTLVVKLDGLVVGAMTIVYNSLLGFPCEDLYRNEIETLQANNRYPAEIISLGIEKNIRGTSEILLKLFNISYIFSKKIRGATDFVITVNPKHTLFYKRKLLFEEIGEEKVYSKVKNAPAVLLKLDLNIPEIEIQDLSSTKKYGFKKLRTLYKNCIPKEKEDALMPDLIIQNKGFSEEDFNYFFVEKNDISLKIGNKKFKYLYSKYLEAQNLPSVPVFL
ncbi:hypothetical protein MNBD_UNCLBAC01-1254 [hydrothermal vent metagenome]|uniref:N-acyl amino acid synthase FeeM catalytic core domain-containing protein n=1 Tax=hydrothermal vent metagenome TaxID=652676 RepID=A0A3B1DP51_9ZZZZ